MIGGWQELAERAFAPIEEGGCAYRTDIPLCDPHYIGEILLQASTLGVEPLVILAIMSCGSRDISRILLRAQNEGFLDDEIDLARNYFERVIVPSRT